MQQEIQSKSNFYGRRKGRGKQNIHDEALQRVLESLDVNKWKNQWPALLWMEIGFGFGEHLVSWLSNNPMSYAIGAEVFESGIIHCMEHLKDSSERCALFTDPVAGLLPTLPNKILDGIFILFPDPWPKKRHHKRRLIQASFLNECHRLLKPQGVIRFASDHPDLVEFTLNQVQSDGRFTWKEGAYSCVPGEWPLWPNDWPTSRYHQKAVAQNKPCAHIVWEKVGG